MRVVISIIFEQIQSPRFLSSEITNGRANLRNGCPENNGLKKNIYPFKNLLFRVLYIYIYITFKFLSAVDIGKVWG